MTLPKKLGVTVSTNGGAGTQVEMTVRGETPRLIVHIMPSGERTSHPVQESTRHPASGCAVSVTVVLSANSAEHGAVGDGENGEQSMPEGSLETRPCPAMTTVTSAGAASLVVPGTADVGTERRIATSIAWKIQTARRMRWHGCD